MLGSWYCNIWFFINKNDSYSTVVRPFFIICKTYRVHWKVLEKMMIVPNIDPSVTLTSQGGWKQFPALSKTKILIGHNYHFYQLILQSWNQKTAQSLVNTLALFSWHKGLP